ncbi:Uncharacterised protein [Mycobacterium tuberculosis]|nr:Uncharacterised protein [Mycobacterium tuberculosis]
MLLALVNIANAFTVLLVLDPFLSSVLIYDVKSISPLGKEISPVHLSEKLQLWEAGCFFSLQFVISLIDASKI